MKTDHALAAMAIKEEEPQNDVDALIDPRIDSWGTETSAPVCEAHTHFRDARW